jgi:cob(I)alamin adenosyltransferase
MAASLADHRPPKRNGAGQVPLRVVPRPEGLLQLYTAPYRGSFAAVYGQALRSAGLGSRVLISQFLKGGVDQGVAGSLWLCGRLQWLRPATPLCLEGPPPAEGGAELRAAVREVWDYSRETLRAGHVDLIVLDELGLAVDLGWLAAEEVRDSLEQRPPHLDVILTGPAMPSALVAMADQVTELRRGL